MRIWLIEARGKETQKSVAEKAGISQNFYSCIENGQRCPSPKVAQRIGEVLGVDWTCFFEETNRESESKAV